VSFTLRLSFAQETTSVITGYECLPKTAPEMAVKYSVSVRARISGVLHVVRHFSDVVGLLKCCVAAYGFDSFVS
jgi:hypothetical protein